MISRIVYIANARIPTEKAHGVAIVKMCEAFAHTGVELELVVPGRLNNMKEDPFEYYGIEKKFKIKKLPTLDFMSWLGNLGFLLEAFTFAGSAFWYGLFKEVDIIYGRDELSLSLLSVFKKNVVWEAHTAKKGFIIRTLLARCKKLVVISRGLKEYYMSFGISENKILVAHSGVDLEEFEKNKETKTDLRRKLELPIDKKIVAYVGKEKTMGMSKGVEWLRGAFELVKEYIPNSYFLVVSHASPKDVPLYMKASDVLIMNYPNIEHYAKYMSPLKMFEYMASGVPMATSDLPLVREVLDDSNAYFFKPDDSSSFKEVIESILNNYGEAENKAQIALSTAKNYSWNKRAESVLGFINKRS